MLFHSPTFFVFFAVVLLLYRRLGLAGQNHLSLVASYVFFGWWDWRFLGLLAFSTAVDFLVAQRIEATDDAARRKRWLWVSLGVNLGLLAFFKYVGFFVDSAVDLLLALGLTPHRPVLGILLPIGISFYTFQTMAYTIDVYRRRTPATRDPVAFAVYVAWFPQLVAGPIERADRLLPQFSERRLPTRHQLGSGALLMLIGYFRKVAIADTVAPHVDRIFSDPGSASSLGIALGVVLFALQIYGDFAGYSDIARGASRMLGVELMQNFEHPYFSTSITEFWRRWHVSLSSWLRDYLYIPLGGNRGGPVKTYRNLMLTMLLGGLWHGAGWNFVIWGGLHGGALAVHKLWRRDRPAAPGRARAIASWAGTMALVCLAWIFFRAHSFSEAMAVLGGLFAFTGGLPGGTALVAVAAVGALLVIDVPQFRRGEHEAILRWPWWVRGVTYAGLVLATLLLSGSPSPFIYFQF
ncbi:MAG: MBOAT family protein [Myxococcales bacterium]|nr:MBOAT family protein [Myxococcales bacterium]